MKKIITKYVYLNYWNYNASKKSCLNCKTVIINSITVYLKLYE